MKGSQRSSNELKWYQTTPSKCVRLSVLCTLLYDKIWLAHASCIHVPHTSESCVCFHFVLLIFHLANRFEFFFSTIKTYRKGNPITCFSPVKRLAHGKSFRKCNLWHIQAHVPSDTRSVSLSLSLNLFGLTQRTD